MEEKKMIEEYYKKLDMKPEPIICPKCNKEIVFKIPSLTSKKSTVPMFADKNNHPICKKCYDLLKSEE